MHSVQLAACRLLLIFSSSPFFGVAHVQVADGVVCVCVGKVK